MMKGRLAKYILITACFALCRACPVLAQTVPPTVEARFVPDSVMIADQFQLEVTVSHDIMQVVAFPEFDSNSIGGVIEILEEYPGDTLRRDGRRVTVRKRYRLTSFEDGYFGIQPFPVLYLDKNITDTLYSDSLRLKVSTFEIDRENDRIYDIKPPMQAPLRFGEIAGYVAIGLGVLALIGLLIWHLIRRRRNLTLFGKPKPVDPPHVAAIKALEMLHNQKLWQNNKHKAYYTRLTDILREYLNGRFGIPAMEMTTDETASAIASTDIDESSRNELTELLRTADLVKFAKVVPPAEENEAAYNTAYYFIERTKPTETEVAARPQEIEEL